MADRIFIEGLRIQAVHGLHDRERQEPQEFLVDISIDLDAAPAGASDKIADTLDYGRLREIAKRVFAGAPRELLEYLASQIAAEVLLDPRALEVGVTIRKTRVFSDCVGGVSITRSRPRPV